jgi:hypothetical protein
MLNIIENDKKIINPLLVLLFVGSIAGLLNSIIFGILDSNAFRDHINPLFLYYIFNSVFSFFAAFLLRKENKLGLYFLIISTVSVFISIFIPVSLERGNLFTWTISISWVLTPITGLASILFLLGLFINSACISLWLRVIKNNPEQVNTSL